MISEDDESRADRAARRRHPGFVAVLLEREPAWALDFDNLAYEWRRLFSEVLGTFLLVLVAAGGAVVGARTNGVIGRAAGVTAPGLMVAGIILFMGAVSGAHLNPAVSLAFALRGDFLWRRVPGYIAAQFAGAVAAAAVLAALFGSGAHLGGTQPGPGFGVGQALATEILVTFGLVSLILGVSSAAQNVGPVRRDRRRFVHHSGWTMGEPGQWRIDESCSLARACVDRRRHLGIIDLLGRTAGRSGRGRRLRMDLRGRGGDRTAKTAVQGKLGKSLSTSTQG